LQASSAAAEICFATLVWNGPTGPEGRGRGSSARRANACTANRQPRRAPGSAAPIQPRRARRGCSSSSSSRAGPRDSPVSRRSRRPAGPGQPWR
jgi:hypothetical protein